MDLLWVPLLSAHGERLFDVFIFFIYFKTLFLLRVFDHLKYHTRIHCLVYLSEVSVMTLKSSNCIICLPPKFKVKCVQSAALQEWSAFLRVAWILAFRFIAALPLLCLSARAIFKRYWLKRRQVLPTWRSDYGLSFVSSFKSDIRGIHFLLPLDFILSSFPSIPHHHHNPRSSHFHPALTSPRFIGQNLTTLFLIFLHHHYAPTNSPTRKIHRIAQQSGDLHPPSVCSVLSRIRSVFLDKPPPTNLFFN